MQESADRDGVAEASAAMRDDDACEYGVRIVVHGVDGAERAEGIEGERGAEEADGGARV